MGMKLTDDIRKAIHKQLTAKPAPPKKPNVHRLSGPGLWNRPFHSEALGVSPEQIPQAREEFKKYGLNIDFDKKGRAIFTCESQRKAACKALGMWSGRDGYCGGINEDGQPILTGRSQANAMKEFKARLYEDFDG